MSSFSCRLLEVDFSGIEAVLVGWFARDPTYLRLAKLGVHAGLASHVIGEPFDARWDDATLKAYLSQIKKKTQPTGVYDRSKRCVHGTGYGLTPHGMQKTYPDLFKTVASAASLQEHYWAMAPQVKTWQGAMQRYAYDHGYLGGPVPDAVTGWGPGFHPFAYRHWFWSVISYSPITQSQKLWRQKRGMPWTEINGKLFAQDLGEDAKRVIAFFPQSTAAGILKEALLRLFGDPEGDHYVGDAYFGRTPLRAPIHDSLLLEVPVRAWDRVVGDVLQVMQAQIPALPCPRGWGQGDYLSIGVEAKAGKNWGAMEKLDEVESLASEVSLVPIDPLEDEDGDEVEAVAALDVEVA